MHSKLLTDSVTLIMYFGDVKVTFQCFLLLKFSAVLVWMDLNGVQSFKLFLSVRSSACKAL